MIPLQNLVATRAAILSKLLPFRVKRPGAAATQSKLMEAETIRQMRDALDEVKKG